MKMIGCKPYQNCKLQLTTNMKLMLPNHILVFQQTVVLLCDDIHLHVIFFILIAYITDVTYTILLIMNNPIYAYLMSVYFV